MLDETFFSESYYIRYINQSVIYYLYTLRFFFCLSEIAADEIDEVDSIMEDITDEINDLQQSMNVSKVPCTINDENKINCNSTVYTGK